MTSNRHRRTPIIVIVVASAVFGFVLSEVVTRARQQLDTLTPVIPVIDTPPPAVASDSVGESIVLESVGIEARLSEYIKLSYPTGSIQYRLGQPRIQRDVSSSLRRKIIARDGGACVICGSTGPFEVDHMRALMNGGGNEPSNLGCLCHDCNASRKKSIDNSIRRQRDKALKNADSLHAELTLLCVSLSMPQRLPWKRSHFCGSTQCHSQLAIMVVGAFGVAMQQATIQALRSPCNDGIRRCSQLAFILNLDCNLHKRFACEVSRT